MGNKEKWRPVPGYAHYAVSNLGRVRSIEHFDNRNHLRPGKILALVEHSNGYLFVSLTEAGKKKRVFSVHRLVASAFIPNDDGKPEVNHKNGDKKDNRVENLEWCTTSENIRHAFKSLGKKSVGSHKPRKNRRLTPEQVRAIRADNRRLVDIAADYGMDHSTIADIKHRVIYADVTDTGCASGTVDVYVGW